MVEWVNLGNQPLANVENVAQGFLKLKLLHCHMGVSTNGGTPKSSILVERSIINHLFWGFWGIPIYGNPPYLPLAESQNLPCHCIFAARGGNSSRSRLRRRPLSEMSLIKLRRLRMAAEKGQIVSRQPLDVTRHCYS